MLLISVIKLFDVQVYPKINGGKVRNIEEKKLQIDDLAERFNLCTA